MRHPLHLYNKFGLNLLTALHHFRLAKCVFRSVRSTTEIVPSYNFGTKIVCSHS
jgi:hypothetical protein